jgi:hypothetical protein
MCPPQLTDDSKPFQAQPAEETAHPLYSPNISPSDFYLFGTVKSALMRREIPDEIVLLEAVTEILNGISDAELQRVFQDWIELVERAIGAVGNGNKASGREIYR